MPAHLVVRRHRGRRPPDEAGALRLGGDGTVKWAGGSPAEAVRAAGEVADSRRRVNRSRVEMMRQYAETTDCRRRILLGYFGEELPEPCGNCDNCRAGSVHAAPRRASRFPPQQPVRHREWGPGLVVASAPDRITVLFDRVGYKTLSVAAVSDQDLLEPAPDRPRSTVGTFPAPARKVIWLARAAARSVSLPGRWCPRWVIDCSVVVR